MSKKNKIIIAVVSIILLIIVALTMFLNRDTKKTVELYEVIEQDPISFSGNVEASEKQEVYLDSTKGKIKEYYVKDGDSVEEGQNLFIYENDTAKTQVEQLNTQYNLAVDAKNATSSQLSKAKGSLSAANKKVTDLTNKIKNISSSITLPTDIEDFNNSNNIGQSSGELTQLQMELEAAKMEVQSLESTIPSLESAVSQANAEIKGIDSQRKVVKESLNYIEKAKISGKVKLDKEAAEAAISMTGASPVITITSVNTIIKGQVSEYDYDKLEVDNKVKIIVANSGEEIGGTIKSIDEMPISNEGQISMNQQTTSITNYNFTVVPDENIHYGFSVNIKLPQEKIYLPLEAVLKEKEKYYIFKVENGKTVKEEIEVELEDGIYKLISGLKLGDKIISNIEGITENMEVKVTDNSESSSTEATKEVKAQENSINPETQE
ncbi:MAG: biotin/lipoyl-binding protein [Miniphocaeibacter sp.]|uniref:efflux RND transporter periplasmic adaptor subunit n=1 Tax=Miniphocaeibacter sp. TaxID=3100973 RepID=UPI0017F54633|nr:biotin/lipoyl-binding protein [Gallicola sp.]